MSKKYFFYSVVLGIASLLFNANLSNADFEKLQTGGEKLQQVQAPVAQQEAFDVLANAALTPQTANQSVYAISSLDLKTLASITGMPTRIEQMLRLAGAEQMPSKVTLASVLGLVSTDSLSRQGQIASAQAMTAVPEVAELSCQEAVPPLRLVIQSADQTPAGNETATEYNLVATTNYVLDDQGRTVKTVTVSGDETKEVAMDPETGAMTGAVITTKTDDGTKMSYFDANWKPIQTVEEKSSGERTVTTYTLDPATGNVAKSTTAAGNKITEITYDPATQKMTGAMVVTSEADGSSRQEFYNADWKSTRTIEDKISGPEMYRHSETTYTLDEATGNPVKSVAVSGDKTTVVNFDPVTNSQKSVAVTTQGADGTKTEYFDADYKPTRTIEDKTTGPEQYRHSETTFERDPATGQQVQATTVSGDKTTVINYDPATGLGAGAEVVTDSADATKRELYAISGDVWTPTQTIEDKKTGDPKYAHTETTFVSDPDTGNIVTSVTVSGDKTTETYFDPATKEATGVIVTTDNPDTTKKEYYTGDWKPIKTIEDKKSGPEEQRHSETTYLLDPDSGNPVSATTVSGNITVVQNFDPQQDGRMINATMTEVTDTGKKVTEFNGDWQPVSSEEYKK